MRTSIYKYNFLCFFLCCGSFLTADAQTVKTDQHQYYQPEKFAFVKYIPSDLWKLVKSPFEKKNLPGLAIVAASTGVLIWQDQNIDDEVHRFAERIHVSGETVNDVPLKIGDARIIKIPQNINTAFYQLGEGGTSMLVAGGLYIYGKITKDYRSLQTASDLSETFITMGIATQLLKRSFGRQTPFMSTCDGGEWQPFPPFKSYQNHTPQYDAFPSGHLATMMATVTVLALNYPQKKWIKPLGYTLIGLTGFAMMNTEVHWASDYPLALALGYVSAKISFNRHEARSKKLKSMELL